MQRTTIIFFTLAMAWFLAGCEQPTTLEGLRQTGVLEVATRNTATTYYQGPRGPAGLEYELVSRFAESLGLEARFVVPDNIEELLSLVRTGQVHMAAAGLTITEERRRTLRFSIPYQQIKEQVVYLGGTKRPRKIADLIGGHLEIAQGSSHEETLQRLKQDHPQLSWQATDLEEDDLLYLVATGAIDYTVADSNQLALNQRFHPRLKAGFTLDEGEQLAWAFPRFGDDTLARAADAFLQGLKDDGTLKQLIERYYGHVGRLNLVDQRTFAKHIKTRLPRYIDWFKQAADGINMDWRLLAAVSYQESHWNAQAVSPTGVRGLMMLTQDTANYLKIQDRNDPKQSIFGGARYIRIIEDKIPQRIPEPDRLWLALAGYNVGFGHLEDARILTERQGGDPDKWVDVKQRLPLLAQKKFYKTVKYGYARGREPVSYVDNIRGYFDLLVWHTEQATTTEARQADNGTTKQD